MFAQIKLACIAVDLTMPGLLSKMEDAAGNFLSFEDCCNVSVKKQVDIEWKSLGLSSSLWKVLLK